MTSCLTKTEEVEWDVALIVGVEATQKSVLSKLIYSTFFVQKSSRTTVCVCVLSLAHSSATSCCRRIMLNFPFLHSTRPNIATLHTYDFSDSCLSLHLPKQKLKSFNIFWHCHRYATHSRLFFSAILYYTCVCVCMVYTYIRWLIYQSNNWINSTNRFSE